MRNNFHRTLLICVPLLLTACSDANEPLIPDPKIATTAISSTSVSLSWDKATDSRSPSTALVYKVYLSGANPAYQSFDTIAEVEAGTLVATLTDASSYTISSDIAAGNAYYINIVILDEKGNKALYDPLGEYFHDGQVSYYPFNGDGNDAVTATANHLAVAVDPTLPNLALPTVTLDRFGYTGSAYSFNSAVPQCLQSTNPVGITGSTDRSVSFWVQSSNTSVSTPRAAFAWGNDSANGTSFGFFEAVLNNYWTVWLGTATVSTPKVTTSSWEHWVITSTGGSVYTYKNGEEANNGDAATVSTLDSPLYVGCGMVASALGYPYQGNIDDVRVFNQLLTGPDVLNLVVNLYAVTRP